MIPCIATQQWKVKTQKDWDGTTPRTSDGQSFSVLICCRKFVPKTGTLEVFMKTRKMQKMLQLNTCFKKQTLNRQWGCGVMRTFMRSETKYLPEPIADVREGSNEIQMCARQKPKVMKEQVV